MQTVIVGCGDIGRRIARDLIAQGSSPQTILGLVNSLVSQQKCTDIDIASALFDLDYSDQGQIDLDTGSLSNAECYYTVAPQKHGDQDLRSLALIKQLQENQHIPSKIVLLSTTGVYGDQAGQWVDENSPTIPQTGRGKRRLNSEQNWLRFGQQNSVPVIILRVPGIYSFSRLPRARIAQATPVVSAVECGFSNRIHADDLAQMAILSMRQLSESQVMNASDGTPGKITEYLQAAAAVLGQPQLPEISMHEAQSVLSAGMLSYLSESRKISNEKLIKMLNLSLKYPDFREGIKFG